MNKIKNKLFVAFFLVACIIFNRFIIIGYVPTKSMEDTIHQGSYVFILKNCICYNQGDVVAFKNNNKIVIKRVIAKNNDIVEIKDDNVYVNSLKLEEKYKKGYTVPGNKSTYIVPKDSYFLLGDNRENSFDSRYYKNFIGSKNVIGKVFFHINI